MTSNSKYVKHLACGFRSSKQWPLLELSCFTTKMKPSLGSEEGTFVCTFELPELKL
jgi:hypothetical protein